MTGSSECMREGLSVLLMASTINKILRHYDSLNVKIEIDTFLGYLKTLIRNYKEIFNRPMAIDIINSKEHLARIIDRNDFKYFVKLQGNTLHIEADIENYPALMKALIVEASRRYSMFLVKNANDLARFYANISDVEESNGAIEKLDVTVVKDTGSEKEDVKKPEKKSNDPQPEENDDDSEQQESSEVSVDKETKGKESKDKDPKDKESEKESSESEESSSEESKDESEKDEEKEATPEPEPKKPVTRRGRRIAKAEAAAEEDEPQESKEKDVKGEQGKDEENDESQEEDKDDEKDEKEDTISRRNTRKRSMSPAVTNPNKRFQNIGINLINNIQSHRFSSVFLQPVNKKEVPDYYEVVHEPKDLKNIMKTLKSKAAEPVYTSLQDLERDIMLMLANCIMFNHSDEDLVNLARTMRDDVINTFKIFREAES